MTGQGRAERASVAGGRLPSISISSTISRGSRHEGPASSNSRPSATSSTPSRRVTDLKAARPDIEVEWLVEEAFAAFVSLHPGGREGSHARLPPPPLAAEPLAAACVGDMASPPRAPRPRLRSCHRPAGADEERAARPPRRPGQRLRCRERPRAGGDAPLSPPLRRAARHARRRADPAAACRGGRLPRTGNDRGFRDCVRTARPTPALGLPPRYAMVMHAASWPTKLWPEEHWRAPPARHRRRGKGYRPALGQRRRESAGRASRGRRARARWSCRG